MFAAKLPSHCREQEVTTRPYRTIARTNHDSYIIGTSDMAMSAKPSPMELSDLLRSNLAFLDQWGLEMQVAEVTHSSLLGDQLLFTFLSKSSKTSIRIHHSYSHTEKPARLAVFIDSGNGKSFYLNDYLLECSQGEMLEFFHNPSPQKPTEVFYRDFAGILRIILENSFSDLLHGKSREIAPFDWSPYK